MNKKLVSIIIPTYKRKSPLERAIKSAQEQTYTNIEIIIVNDNDYDEYTEYILKLYEKLSIEDNRIKLVNYNGNRNGAYARNAGLAKSIGEYIAFLDDDDIFYSRKIAMQVQYLEDKHPRFDAVYCKMVKPSGSSIRKYYEGDLSKFILKQQSISPTPTLLFTRKSILEIGGFDIKLLRHQDYDLMLRFFEKFQIGFVDEYLTEQGENEGENMIYGQKLEKTKIYFLNKFSQYINKLSKYEAKEIYVINYFNMGIANLKAGKILYSIKHFIQSFFFSPSIFAKQIFSFISNRISK